MGIFYVLFFVVGNRYVDSEWTLIKVYFCLSNFLLIDDSSRLMLILDWLDARIWWMVFEEPLDLTNLVVWDKLGKD